MLLRSSSTPVLGSLLSSFSDTPNNLDTNKHHYSTHHQIFSRSPYHQTGCLHLSTVSYNSSPISPSIADLSDCSLDGLRRAQSESNLEGLAYISRSNNNEECSNPSHPMKVSARKSRLMLETIPSFSLYNLRGRDEEEEDEDYDKSDVEYDEEEKKQVEANEAMGSGPSSSSDKMENMVLSEQVEVLTKGSLTVGFEEKGGLMISEEMYLAKGLGIDGGNSDGNGSGAGSGGNCGGGGGGKFHWGGEDGGDMGGTEEYYKKMLQENPGNSLFLRNYAEYLYQVSLVHFHPIYVVPESCQRQSLIT